jgi:hypothetical protein
MNLARTTPELRFAANQTVDERARCVRAAATLLAPGSIANDKKWPCAESHFSQKHGGLAISNFSCRLLPG